MQMKTRIQLYACIAVLLASTACTTEELPLAEDTQSGNSEQIQPVAGEVLVKFAPYVADVLEQAGSKTRGGAPISRSGVLSVDEVLDIVGGYELERVFPVDEGSEAKTREAGLHQWYIVRFNRDYSVQEVAQQLAGLGEVQKVSPNRTIKRAYNTEKKVIPLTRAAYDAMSKRAATRADGASELPFNDQLLPMQWDIINDGTLFQGVEDETLPGSDPETHKTPNKAVKDADVQCAGAWEKTKGDPSIIVAVLDEGICLTHPDLKYNIWTNEDEIDGSDKDNDKNGYTGDRHGYNFVKNSGVITWDAVGDTGHGSHVAGVIAARNGNNEGICSIAGGTEAEPGVKIMSCQIFSGNLSAASSTSVRAIKYAADNGAVILQCSWGYTSGTANIFEWGAAGFTSQEEWEEYCPLEKEALDYFFHNAGSPNGPIDGGLAIFAAGNESADMAGFPGAAEEYIAVTATAADYTPAIYTNYGVGCTIAAPGGDQDYYYEYTTTEHPVHGEIGCILSTVPTHVSETGYGYMEGTSMACPHVSGVAALGLSYAVKQRKHFTAEEFKQLLYESATPIDAVMTGSKGYCRYVSDLGPNHYMLRELNAYRGKMGAGQVNALRLLEAIDNNGRIMTFPNLYIPLDGKVSTIPANYFLDGENRTYTVSIKDESIATVSTEGATLVFSGLKTGMTQASITGDGETQHFNITVRKSANGNGWL